MLVMVPQIIAFLFDSDVTNNPQRFIEQFQMARRILAERICTSLWIRATFAYDPGRTKLLLLLADIFRWDCDHPVHYWSVQLYSLQPEAQEVLFHLARKSAERVSRFLVLGAVFPDFRVTCLNISLRKRPSLHRHDPYLL